MKENKNENIDNLLKENEKLKNENIEFEKILKDLEKKIRGKTWIWFFVPIFGLVIYMNINAKRKESKEFGPALLNIKTEIARNELKIKINELKIEKNKKI